MRAICCLLVVIIHVTAAFWYTFTTGSPQFKAVIVLNTLSKFAVPSFVLISGYVLYYVNYNKKVEALPFYKKRISKVLVPYLIWSILYIFVNYLAYARPIDMKSLIYYFGLGKANYHLYYICLILQLYILFPLIFKIYQSIENKIFATAIFFIFNSFFIRFIKFEFSDRFFTYYIMFFVLGFFLADLKIRAISFHKIVPVIISIFYFLITSYYILDTYKVNAKVPLLSKELYRHSWWYFSLISILFLYTMAAVLNKYHFKIVSSRAVQSISKHSFTIYLSHPMFMKVLHSLSLFEKIKSQEPTLTFVLELICIFMGSWLFSILLDQFIARFKTSKKIIT